MQLSHMSRGRLRTPRAFLWRGLCWRKGTGASDVEGLRGDGGSLLPATEGTAQARRDLVREAQ